ncbi:hypothetical protein [Candidatus Magnetaquicoccus inordinatus]|uniref:hypothetical protein n=1 Tax=Candidatus Magnetaquicoccus inordinatus TaxID=2496818 RepID=UPI00102B6160|nr:hypothetical protein [Candidatus Magnetaquicoccus inordinatus]
MPPMDTTTAELELATLKEQQKAAKEAYKVQQQTIKLRMVDLKEEAKRAKKIAKLESRLNELKGILPPLPQI